MTEGRTKKYDILRVIETLQSEIYNFSPIKNTIYELREIKMQLYIAYFKTLNEAICGLSENFNFLRYDDL